jgi:hypothetical protein
MYHGAALTQVAEHDLFTSINAVRFSKKLSRSSFRINETIGIFLKYAGNPVGDDYNFTFSRDNKKELVKLRDLCEKVFIALVCVADRQICCISLDEFDDWIEKRHSSLGSAEDVSTILVHLPKGKAFRVNMNKPGRRNTYLANPQIVSRKSFPNALFE